MPSVKITVRNGQVKLDAEGYQGSQCKVDLAKLLDIISVDRAAATATDKPELELPEPTQVQLDARN